METALHQWPSNVTIRSVSSVLIIKENGTNLNNKIESSNSNVIIKTVGKLHCWFWMMSINNKQLSDRKLISIWKISQSKSIQISLNAVNIIQNQLSSDVTTATNYCAANVYLITQVAVIQSICSRKVKLFKIAIILLVSASSLFKILTMDCKILSKFQWCKLKWMLIRLMRLLCPLPTLFLFKFFKINNSFFLFSRGIWTFKIKSI